MVRYDERSGALHATELGRIASHFYVTARTVVSWAECLRPRMDEADFLAMLSRASEFDNVALRDDEAGELEELRRSEVRGRRREQGKAQTLQQLIHLGQARGMKNPVGWAKHVYFARQRAAQP